MASLSESDQQQQQQQLGSEESASAPQQASQSSRGYLTKDGDFFLGHTGQDCASVCFSASRSCSADLGSVSPEAFTALGVSCKPLPAQLEGVTMSRYNFPGWISANDNIYFGSCFNTHGVAGEVSCTEAWDAGSRICVCLDDSKSRAVDALRISGLAEAIVASILCLYILYALFKRCRRRQCPCCAPEEARFASIKDAFDIDENAGIGEYDSDDEDSQGLLAPSPTHRV